MSPRGSVAPVVASGTASVVKLLVATLAFTGAYVGVEASRTASAGAGAEAPAQTVTLSSKAVPDSTAQDTSLQKAVFQNTAAQDTVAQDTVAQDGAARVPAVGTVTVSPVTESEPCDKPYRFQSVIDNPHPERAVSYGWRLQRWSEGSRSWRTYLSGNSGFTGRRQTVEWQPHVVDNPGWYRATLSVSGAPSLRSEKFRVSC
ncbi:hypothetical protein [Streptosporangium sp. NPDC051022]|uniref:hypothetical protein n=1 Tax=Streptosporangium sp. NPDC051022 TaxID=3155752 RepID=UPI00341DC7A4